MIPLLNAACFNNYPNGLMRGEPAPEDEKGHIGLENAILRFDMYTDGRGILKIDSHLGEGTTVEMEFPEADEEQVPL